MKIHEFDTTVEVTEFLDSRGKEKVTIVKTDGSTKYFVFSDWHN